METMPKWADVVLVPLISLLIAFFISGLVIWPIAGWMLAGGLLGGAVGVWASRKLAGQRALLQRLFAIFVLVVAAHVGWRAIAPV